MRFYLLFFLLLFSVSCGGKPDTPKTNLNSNRNSNAPVKQAALPVSSYEIVNTFPHDPKAFTEGLFFHDGFLYESTGETGKSELRKVELKTGKVLQKFALPSDNFGEGTTLFDGKIYQLTWRQGLCRVFDAKDFTLIRQFDYRGEGWGMTTDGEKLYMTDSTHVIRVINPETFQPIKTLAVFREDGRPLLQINELEFVKGELWANVWHSEKQSILGKPNYIARIDPDSGKLLGWINLQGISPDDQPAPAAVNDESDPKSENTLNGIAYDAATERIFVTGKNWTKLYEIKVKPEAE